MRPAALRGLGGAASLVVALALTLSLAGCDNGDDGGGRDGTRRAKTTPGAAASQTRATAPETTPAQREAVRAAVVRLLKSDDVRVICERSLTPRLFRLIFATQAACRKAAAEDDEDKPTERVEVSHIRIEGGRASAHAELVGGDSAGAKGDLSLAKRGGSWRGDDFSPAFLRSLVNTSLRNDDEVPRAVRRCIGNRFAQIPDARFKRLAYSLIGHQPQATTRLLGTLSACERKRGGRSSVRRRLEQNVRKELGQAGASGVEVGCVLRRLRTTLPDALVIKLVSDKSRRSKARITRELVSAAIACGAGNPSDPGELSPA